MTDRFRQTSLYRKNYIDILQVQHGFNTSYCKAYATTICLGLDNGIKNNSLTEKYQMNYCRLVGGI